MPKRIVSLGGICEVAYQIKMHTSKVDADYFDWLIVPFDTLIKAISLDFQNFLFSQDFDIYFDQKAVYNKVTNIMYFHDFPLMEDRSVDPDFRSYFHKVEGKYNYLKDKFLSLSRFEGHATFIRRDASLQQADILYKTIRDRFPSLNFELLIANEPHAVFSQPQNDRIIPLQVPRSGADGLGQPEAWCSEFKRIGLIESGYKKEYSQIVRIGHRHVFD